MWIDSASGPHHAHLTATHALPLGSYDYTRLLFTLVWLLQRGDVVQTAEHPTLWRLRTLACFGKGSEGVRRLLKAVEGGERLDALRARCMDADIDHALFSAVITNRAL